MFRNIYSIPICQVEGQDLETLDTNKISALSLSTQAWWKIFLFFFFLSMWTMLNYLKRKKEKNAQIYYIKRIKSPRLQRPNHSSFQNKKASLNQNKKKQQTTTKTVEWFDSVKPTKRLDLETFNKLYFFSSSYHNVLSRAENRDFFFYKIKKMQGTSIENSG